MVHPPAARTREAHATDAGISTPVDIVIRQAFSTGWQVQSASRYLSLRIKVRSLVHYGAVRDIVAWRCPTGSKAHFKGETPLAVR
jgi:hypothetical protein